MRHKLGQMMSEALDHYMELIVAGKRGTMPMICHTVDSVAAKDAAELAAASVPQSTLNPGIGDAAGTFAGDNVMPTFLSEWATDFSSSRLSPTSGPSPPNANGAAHWTQTLSSGFSAASSGQSPASGTTGTPTSLGHPRKESTNDLSMPDLLAFANPDPFANSAAVGSNSLGFGTPGMMELDAILSGNMMPHDPSSTAGWGVDSKIRSQKQNNLVDPVADGAAFMINGSRIVWGGQ